MNQKENNQEAGCGCGTADIAINLCPHCNSKGIELSAVTLKAHLRKEKFQTMSSSKDDFNFCTTPKCDTVYYSNDGEETFSQADVRSKVAIKNDDLKTPLCYCKKLLKQNVLDMIKNKEEDIPTKISKIISEGKTFCEKANPRGTCCPEEITKFLADYGIDYGDSTSPTCGDGGSCGTSTDVKEESPCCGEKKEEVKESSCCDDTKPEKKSACCDDNKKELKETTSCCS